MFSLLIQAKWYCEHVQSRRLEHCIKKTTKTTKKNNYLRLDGQSEFEEKAARKLQNVRLKWNRKQRKQVPFRVVVSLHPPGGNNFVPSRNSTATLQHDFRQMCPWLLERLPVNYFELYESLNFESVQDVKIGSKRRIDRI